MCKQRVLPLLLSKYVANPALLISSFFCGKKAQQKWKDTEQTKKKSKILTSLVKICSFPSSSRIDISYLVGYENKQ